MTTLYRPVQVLNDAQRAALPKGSFMHPNCYLGGILTYLVPIEAEEEFGAGGDGMDEDFYLTRRLVTPWEAV